MKKILIIVLSFILFIFSFGNDKSNPEKINITYVKAPLNIPSILGKNHKLFEKKFMEDGTKIKFYEMTTGPEQIAALASGSVDFLFAVSAPSAIIAASNGVPLTIINVYTRAPKVFNILTMNENIKSPKDLIGKKIVGPKGTILHQLLVAYLKTENINQNQVEFINMGLPGAMSALINGTADVALLAGPVALNAVKSGAKIVTTGENLVQGLVVTAVRNDFLEKYPNSVKKFQMVNGEILDIINNNFDGIVDEVALEVNNTTDEVKKMYPLYDFNIEIKDEDIKDLKNTQDFLLENGLQKNKIDINSILKLNK